MGEFVGIDPDGARKLLDAMKKAREGLNGELGEPLKYGLRVAQSDGTAEAHASPKRYGDYAALLDKWIKDLDRRIAIITNMPKADLGRDGNKVTATLPTPEEAAGNGKNAADALTKAWDEYQKSMGLSDYAQKRQAFLDALKKYGAQAHDPEFATAFLKQFGADKLNTLLQTFMDTGRPDNRYLVDGNYQFWKETLAPLATMIGVSDKAGMLPDDFRKELLKTDIGTLSVFLRMAPQSERMARDVFKIAWDHRHTPDGKLAMTQIPEIISNHPKFGQEILVNDEYRNWLLNGSNWTTYGDYGKSLGPLFRTTLAPGAGDPALQQKIWPEIIRKSNDESFRGLINRSPDVAQALAENFRPYLLWAADKQAREFGKDMNLPFKPLPNGTATLDNGLSLDDIKNFMGMVNTDDKARNILLAEAKKLMDGGQGMRLITPEVVKKGELENLDLQAALAQDQALLALMLAGVQRASIDGDNRRAQTADALKGLVVGYLTMPAGPAGPVVDVGTSGMTTPAFKWLTDKYFDAVGDKEYDPEEFYNDFKKAYREQTLEYLRYQSNQLPVGERPSEDKLQAMANQLYDHFRAQGGEAMLKEFWKESKK